MRDVADGDGGRGQDGLGGRRRGDDGGRGVQLLTRGLVGWSGRGRISS